MAVLLPTTVANHAYAAGFRGVDLVEMVAIAGAESSYNTNAVNSSSGATGLWQILPSAHPEFAGQNLKDPAVNARAAFSVYTNAPNPGKITKNKWSAYQGLAYWALLPAANAAVAATSLPGVGQVTTAASSGVDSVTGAATSAVQSGAQAAQVASSAYETITNPHNWLRVAYGLAGIGLVWFAVMKIEAGAISNSQAAQMVIGTTKKVVTKGTVS